MGGVLWLSVALLAGLYICGPIVDPDLFWHITAGRWMIAHHSVPHVELWNMFAVGEPWRAYSWSFEVPVALVELYFGTRGLAVLKMVLSVLLSLSLCWTMSVLARDWFLGALLGMFVTAACFNHFTLRPQSVTWILLAVGLALADRLASSQRFTAQQIAATVLLFALWANLHITTAIGILLCSAWLATFGSVRRASFFACAAFAGTFLTPYLGAEWLIFLQKTTHPLQHASIAEFQPATILQYSTAFLLITSGMLVAFMVERIGKLSQHVFVRTELPLYLIAGGLLLGSLAVVKFLPVATILIAALVAKLWHLNSELPTSNLREGIGRLEILVKRLPYEGASFLVLVLALLEGWRFWNHQLDERLIPVALTDYYLAENIPGPLLNDFGRGGYLMYRFSDRSGIPHQLVTIDGRTNVTPPEVFEEYLASFQGRENWRDFFERSGARSVLWRLDSPLVAILHASGQWCELGRSGSGMIGHVLFLKRSDYDQGFQHLPSVNCGTADAEGDAELTGV